MIPKTVFSAFGYAYCKRFKPPQMNPLSLDHRKSFKAWTPLCYPTVAFKLTDIGEGIREVTVKQCHIKEHQKVSQFDDICDVESDKATVTITSRFDGFVKKVHFQEGDVIAVGSTLLDIEVDDQPQNADVAKAVPMSVDRTEVSENEHQQTVVERQQLVEGEEVIERGSSNPCDKALATPAVRRIAKEHGVDINHIQGTGKQGRVTKEDLLVYLNQPRLDDSQPQPVSKSVSSSSQITAYRKVMFKTMTESNKIPTLTLSDEMDVTHLEVWRKALKTDLQAENVKLTLLAFVVKAISLSLQQFPSLNATLEGETVTVASYHNIGIAVDTAAGLVVPNIKNVQQLSIRQVATEAQRLQKLAVEGRLSLADTHGGTFTVSNIGSIAGTIVKPLILPPQVAIVGIGRIRQLPRFDQNDVVRKCSVMNASWAADHRVVDGATVARFSNAVKRYLENPGLLAIDA